MYGPQNIDPWHPQRVRGDNVEVLCIVKRQKAFCIYITSSVQQG
jgi:hypothetical protein